MAVYLFGSYGTPFQTPLSDVDLALVLSEETVSSAREIELTGLILEILQEDDLSVTILNRAPLALRYRVLAEGRCLLKLDEIAHADFVERTLTLYQDFAIEESSFFREYDRALLEDYGDGSR